MHDTARELAAELDSKMSALEQLIREADRAAARLEQSLAAAPQSVESPGVTRAEPASQADGLRSSSRAGLPLEDEAPGADVAPASGGDKRRYDEIYMLSDYGYPAAEIARRAGVPIGEIELILSLRNNR